VLESVAYRLHIPLVILWRGNVGLGDVCSDRDTASTVTRKSVSGHAAVDDTLARQTGDVGNAKDGSTVLANRREGRQGEDAPTT
jgi:hypothetical protein